MIKLITPAETVKTLVPGHLVNVSGNDTDMVIIFNLNPSIDLLRLEPQ